MTFKEFLVYLSLYVIFCPFSFWLFGSNVNYTLIEILIINGLASSIVGTVIHAIFKFSYINIHRDITYKKRQYTRWFGVAIQSIVYIIALFIFRKEIESSISFIKLSIYLIPLTITVLLALKYKSALHAISYEI